MLHHRAWISALASVAIVSAQLPKADTSTPRQQALLAEVQLTADDFQREIKDSGFQPTRPAPAIQISTIPQLSVFFDPSDTVVTGQWEELPPQVKQLMEQMLGGRQGFEDGFHKFFFVHELGHWAQSQGKKMSTVNQPPNHYLYELEANRISIAYWRRRDFSFANNLISQYRKAYDAMPNPVPAGEKLEDYFNGHYDDLGRNPAAYGWYQLRLVIAAADEKPAPTLAQLLKALPDLTYP
jgi:hypothetical protein